MATPIILPAGRRSCEENRLRRAWASATWCPERQPANYLRLLLGVLESPRPVYRRMAEMALAANAQKPDAERIAKATKVVQAEIETCRTERAKFNAYWYRTAA